MYESIQSTPQLPAVESNELCFDARNFVQDPRGFFLTQAVKSDLAILILKKLEEQSASGQLERLYHHEEDWINLGFQGMGTMIH